LSALKQSATDISTRAALRVSQVTTSDAAAVRTSPNTTTVQAGDYSVVVDQLAESKRMKSTALSANYTTSKEIRLTLAIPGFPRPDPDPSPEIVVSTGKTPAQIVTAINDWIKTNASNSQVQASLLNTGAGAPLTIVVQGKSGIANEFMLTSSDPAELNFEQLTPPRNSVFYVNGLRIERSSNTVDDVIGGVTLDLRSATTNPVTISTRPDSASVVANIQNFVATYNTISDFIRKATGPKINGDAIAGSLQNDPSAKSLASRLRAALMAEYTEKPTSVNRLSALGITFNRDGVLTFDDTSKFITVFESTPDDVINLLSNNAPSPYLSSGGKSGVAGDIAVLTHQMTLSSRGPLTLMTKGHEDMLVRIDKQQSALDRYVERIKENYERQFAALNSALAAFKSTSSQLEQSLNLSRKD
jgi:flagellar hook-associated protein 2